MSIQFRVEGELLVWQGIRLMGKSVAQFYANQSLLNESLCLRKTGATLSVALQRYEMDTLHYKVEAVSRKLLQFEKKLIEHSEALEIAANVDGILMKPMVPIEDKVVFERLQGFVADFEGLSETTLEDRAYGYKLIRSLLFYPDSAPLVVRVEEAIEARLKQEKPSSSPVYFDGVELKPGEPLRLKYHREVQSALAKARIDYEPSPPKKGANSKALRHYIDTVETVYGREIPSLELIPHFVQNGCDEERTY